MKSPCGNLQIKFDSFHQSKPIRQTVFVVGKTATTSTVFPFFIQTLFLIFFLSHVILANQPYEAYDNLDSEFELRNVSDGGHTVRVFPSRPWHESYKDDGAFQMVKFTVKNGDGDANKPTTTSSGNTIANANSNADTSATPEGKEMKASKARAFDSKKPLLTYSRPKGEYKGADAENIMIDFWLLNAKLKGDGG